MKRIWVKHFEIILCLIKSLSSLWAVGGGRIYNISSKNLHSRLAPVPCVACGPFSILAFLGGRGVAAGACGGGGRRARSDASVVVYSVRVLLLLLALLLYASCLAKVERARIKQSKAPASQDGRGRERY